MRALAMAAMAAIGLGGGVAEGALAGPGATIPVSSGSTHPDNLFGTTPPQAPLVPGAFEHNYRVLFGDLGSFDTTASSRVAITSFGAIDDLTLSILDGIGNLILVDRDPDPLRVWFNNPGGGLLAFNGDPATEYVIRISGAAGSGGFYQGTVNVFLTPIPAGVVLLSAALGTLGLLGRARDRGHA